jgi:hypothetical protein
MLDVDLTFALFDDVTVAGNQFAQRPLFPVTVPPTGDQSGSSQRECDQLHTLCTSPPNDPSTGKDKMLADVQYQTLVDFDALPPLLLGRIRVYAMPCGR